MHEEPTPFVPEPKVAEAAPTLYRSEYEKEYEKEQALIRKKMAKDTTLVKTTIHEVNNMSFGKHAPLLLMLSGVIRDIILKGYK